MRRKIPQVSLFVREAASTEGPAPPAQCICHNLPGQKPLAPELSLSSLRLEEDLEMLALVRVGPERCESDLVHLWSTDPQVLSTLGGRRPPRG